MRDIFDDEKDSEESDFAQMFEDSMNGLSRNVQVGDKVRGEILTIGKEEVFVSTGSMDDGMVMKSDLLNAEGAFAYKIGDFLDLFVVATRNNQVILSPKPTAKNMAEDLEDAHDMMLPVEGKVIEICNGGFRVQLMGKMAFCPISQMDSRRIEDSASYVGKKFDFLITQFSEKGRNVVVSRRKLLDGQKEQTVATFQEDHKSGDVMKGIITRVEKYGAFVEVGPGLEGLCHISELAWSRVENPADVVSVGQEVSVKVIKIEEGAQRLQISLSMKQAESEPWSKFPMHLMEGEIVPGRVTRLMKFGAFVEVASGIEGLVPLSEMSHTKRVLRADEVVKEGERIDVLIKEIQPLDRRMTLSIKDAEGMSDASSGVPISAPGTRPQPNGSIVSLGAADVKSMGTLAEQFAGLFAAPTAGDAKASAGKPAKEK